MARRRALLLLSGVAAAAGEHTLRSTTTEEVPTFYHLTEYKGVVCNGTAFTDNKVHGCNGWTGLSEHECKMKCAGGETPAYCPKRLCAALTYYSGGGGWCHLFNHSNCLGTKPYFYASTFKKEHGNTGGFLNSPAAQHINLGALALAASAAAVAMAEMSARHKNASAEQVAGAVAGAVHGAVAKISKAAASTTTASTLPSALAAVTAAPVAVLKKAGSATHGAVVHSTTQADTITRGTGSSFAVDFPSMIALLVLLLFLFFCGCAVWQAMKKRRQDSGGTEFADEEEAEYFRGERRGMASQDPEFD